MILCALIRQGGAAPGPFLLCCWIDAVLCWPYNNAGIFPAGPVKLEFAFIWGTVGIFMGSQ